MAILSTLVFLAVSILLVLRLARSISRPVKRVTDRMVAFSNGDLHTEVLPVNSGDELEVMTQTLEDTLGSMNRYISDIQQVLAHVAGGDLRTEPQVDYKGDFTLIRGSLHTIAQSMNDAKPFPAAPARAASTEALMARRLVWKAMSPISLAILVICWALPLMSSMAEDRADICSLALWMRRAISSVWDLRTGPQVDYKGDFTLIRGSLHTIAQSMNETLLGFRSAADRLR